MKKEFLECGKVVTTHGIRGELKVQPWCDGPEFLCDFPTLYLDGQGSASLRVVSAKAHKNMTIIKVEGIDTMEAAEGYRGKILFIRRSDAHMEPGDYFIQDLIGLRVVDGDDPNLAYGTLSDVSETGANDVYHITTPQGGEVLIPAIKQVVLSVDLEGETMVIRPLKGLFDDAD